MTDGIKQQNKGRVVNKVAIVTGSTGGIGEGIARRLAEEGAMVAVSGRRADEGERVVGEIVRSGGRAFFVEADIAKPADCRRLIQATVDRCGGLDILVNNAAIFPHVELEDQTPELWDEVFAVNVRGAFLCCQAAIPHMRRRGGGRIINIGSTLAYRALAYRLPYACSKGALLTMTKALAQSLLGDRILVNFVIVGWVVTPGEIELRNHTHGDGLRYLEESASRHPLGRLETAEDIAAGVLYLASDEASHVTGCELNISGGLLI
jgi:NAD(P)-dependent dehydrogenase (short-subunit alcohol dehydrogenase family)